MKLCWLAVLLSPLLLAGPQTGGKPTLQQVANVNSRYEVEGVEVTGEGDFTLSQALNEDLQRMVGEKLDQTAVESLAVRIRRELHARQVTHRLVRGGQPDHVRIVFEVTRRSVEFDVSVPRFLYHSKQGWTGEVEGAVTYSGTTAGFGLVSDGDELPERNAGLFTRLEHRRLGTDRLRPKLRFESFHQQWNRATLQALDRAPQVPGIYRTRMNIQPSLTFVLAKSLTLEAGLSFQRLEFQFPAARQESSNSVVNTLRYHRQWEDSDARKQSVDAGYYLRAATHALSSDFAYTRHRWNAGYSLVYGKQAVLVQFTGGLLSGRAPLYERYVLGNSGTLRGWNRFDVAPLGGDRMAHGSVTYRLRWIEVFCDTGAVWNRGQDRVARTGLGAGLRKDGFSLAVAFPVREGRADPVIMAGMNF
ncbi:MAG: BamA/TamA family outer membrane protein [Candidatus Solibacter usitatus]|nr:BamA/TamA family outer membrane protein [Candidatus Solibacter usitatus]